MSGVVKNPLEAEGSELECNNVEASTSTALWVINHANPGSVAAGDSSASIRQSPSTDSILKIGLSSSLSQSQINARRDYSAEKDSLTRSKSADIKNSIDDLSSIASTQTRLRLQLKRVKLFSLRKFRNSQNQNKLSMHSSNESVNSEDSGSVSLNSSFISLSRPSFPADVKTHESSFTGSQRSLKSPQLVPFNPPPAFNNLADKLLHTNLKSDNNNSIDTKKVSSLVVMKSPSDSTLLNDSSHSSDSSTETDEGADVQSPPTTRRPDLALVPSFSRAAERREGEAGSTGDSSHSTGASGERRRRKKNGRGKGYQTHPPFVSRVAESDEDKGSAKDDNMFVAVPPLGRLRAQADHQEANHLSKDSLFPSEEHLAGAEDSPWVQEVLEELKKTPALPSKVSRNPNRNHRSEPFPNGSADQFVGVGAAGVKLQSVSSPAIHQSVISLQSVKEDSVLTDPEIDDLVEEPEEVEDTTQYYAKFDAQRKEIIQEIIDSEQKYVNNLGQIREAVKQIREVNILDDESLYTIFHNIRLTESAVHHSIFLEMMKKLVTSERWDPAISSVGSIFYDTFEKESLHDNYQVYVKNCDKSKSLIKQQLVRNAAFSKFNEKFKERNKSGFDLRDAVILPANRLSSYSSLLERYLKHTPPTHPDYLAVPKAISVVKLLLGSAGGVRPSDKQETLQTLEKLLDLSELQAADREFLRVDTVTISGDSQEYRLWMFTDLLLITINRKPRQSSTRKPSTVRLHGQHGLEILPDNRRYYKLYKRVGLDDAEVLNSPENEVKKYASDIHQLESDLKILRDIQERSCSLSSRHEELSRQVVDMISKCEKNLQVLRQRTQDTDLSSLKLQFQTAADGNREYRMVFKDSNSRSAWEKDLLSARLNLEMVMMNKLPPEFLDRIPVERSRAGMQFTCASASLAPTAEKEVWFCNSDSSAGQLIRLAVSSKPSIIDITPVPSCNSRISAICATPPHSEPVLHIFDSPTSSPRLDTRQALMWLGCDDGTLHVVAASPGLRPFSDGDIELNCEQPVLGIVHINNKVFVALNKRRIHIYHRNHDGTWNLDKPRRLEPSSQGTISMLLPVTDKLWCACGNEISIIDPESEKPERSFNVSSEKNASVQSMAYSRQGIVAVTLKNSCDIKLFHHSTFKHLTDVNIFSTVAQKLSKCDEIIKQHKTACLKITSLVCCKHMLWVGTTAGVVLTLRLPKILSNDISQYPFDLSSLSISALNIGHTGNVRFLTFAELIADNKQERRRSVARQSLVSKLLVISGGDGYEVIDPSQQSKDVGFNDCINHLLAWKM